MLILIIDDEEGMLSMMKDFLEKRGHSVITSVDAQDGIKQAVEQLPRLIIMDISMPQMNGYEACEILRSKKETAKIPILIVTGKELTSEGINQRCKEMDINGFMYKPFSVKDLLEKIEKFL